VNNEKNASFRTLLLVIAAITVFTLIGFEILAQNPIVHDQRYWIMSRSSAIAAYIVLTIVMVLGNLLSNPRNKDKWKLSKYLLPWHQAFITATYTLVILHLCFTAIDPKSGVSFKQMWFPIHSLYHPYPMLAGTIGLYLLILIGFTASIRKRFKKWLNIHRLSVTIWFLVTFHGFMGGSDSRAFIVMYGLSTLVTFGTFFYRHWSVKKQPKKRQANLSVLQKG
jgi:DMSO/TMAO reductase YedYZ heme-binding membrane subunit